MTKKAKARVKTNPLVTVKVPLNLVTKVRTMIQESATPPKPIKRKELFTAKQSRELWRLLKKARPLFDRAVEAFDKIEDIEYDNLNKADAKWADDYAGRMGSVFNFLNNELNASFY